MCLYTIRLAAVRRGQRDAGERDHPGHAADDHEDLKRQHRGQSRGQQLREAIVGQQRGLEAAEHEQQVGADQPGRAKQPDLVDEHRVYEVRMGGGEDRSSSR